MQHGAALLACKLFLLCILLWSALKVRCKTGTKGMKQKKWVMSDIYREDWERQGVMGRTAEMGRSVAPWVLVTGRASSEDGMFQRNMLPIHGGQEIKLALSLSLSLSLHLLPSLSALTPSPWIQLPVFLPYTLTLTFSSSRHFFPPVHLPSV